MNILCFWGKAQPCDPDRGPTWHPLVFHCLDVAAVGEALLKQHHGLSASLTRFLDLPREETSRLVCYLLCLHDIGKFAKKFQAKVPNLYPDYFSDDPEQLAGTYDHGAGGLRLADADVGFFKLPSGVRPSLWRPLISAVTGHHGAPPASRMGETLTTLRSDFGAPGIEAARAFIHQTYELFPPPVVGSTGFDRDRVRRGSFALAGLAVLADWIGSNQQWFRYRKPSDFEDIDAYWGHAREKAASAIAEAGVLPAHMQDRLDYGALIGTKARPSPMQDWAGKVKLPMGPALFMIEDETGSGKTEAALMLAHRLMVACRADGLYIALPTMATANAMFDRLSAACGSLFMAGANPSIALVHGARDFHGFRSAVLRGDRNEAPYSEAPGQVEESDTTASTACAAWIADDRRRSFLADVGAGTVDQALLSVLPSRHQSLRLLGLMRRVLVLDEVHAYDAYMQREIETLLEFQAGLGGSAILLSATLPLAVRERLADAFSNGLSKHADAAEGAGNGMDYPLATVRAAGVRTSAKVPGRRERARALPVRFLRAPGEAFDAVEKAAGAGKAVLYLRNTVDDALDAYTELAARGLNPALFHARFTLADRLMKEELVVKTFGKDSGDGRVGKVLVATQVVEQSLDLDFDVLITDLAPVDLLIQRAGRLWRHDWRKRQGRPELLVVSPPPVAAANADWFKTLFPRAAFVYRDHGRLWLTAKVLEETGVIESPGGLRSLIESVYGDEAGACVPDDLMGSFLDAEGRAGAERGVATTNVLALARGYVRDGGAWDGDMRTPTRLADDPQVTLRLACVRDGRIQPYAQENAPDEPWRAWRLSEVNLPARRVGGEALPSDLGAAAQAAKKAGWTRFDADKILIVLRNTTSSVLSGEVLAGADRSTKALLTYSRDRGLTFG